MVLSSVAFVPAYVHFDSLEASLGQIESVRQQLAADERALQDEIKTLQAELQKSHDPQRMQAIQEMISVREDFSARRTDKI